MYVGTEFRDVLWAFLPNLQKVILNKEFVLVYSVLASMINTVNTLKTPESFHGLFYYLGF